MVSLSPHGLRGPSDPSRRGFLITMLGAGVMLGYARRSLAGSSNCRQRQRVVRTDHLVQHQSQWGGVDQHHAGRDGPACRHRARPHRGRRVGGRLEQGAGRHRRLRSEMGRNDDGRQLVGVPEFPGAQPGRGRGPCALIEEGARLLGVSPQRCEARNGAVHANGRSILYGDIVARGDLRRAYTPDQLKTIPIKKPADRRLIGKDTLALDVPSKTDGKGRYGIDAVVEGMIYARPKIPPTRYDSKVASIDDSAAKRVPGYIQSLALDDPSGTAPGWVMVYAESFSAANRAADLVKVKWNSGPAAHVSEADLQQRAAALIADPKAGALVVDDPGVDAALTSAKQQLERTYTTSTVMHFALEPINALAFEKNGVFEIHTGNQWQTLILPVLAKALGRGQDTIVLRSYLLGEHSAGGWMAITRWRRHSQPRQSGSR